jgi:hypothetical protein
MQEVSGSIPLGSTISSKIQDDQSRPSDHSAPFNRQVEQGFVAAHARKKDDYP